MNIIAGRCRIGGGFGRVFPVGDMVMDVHVQGFYNGVTAPAAGITNVGNWTALLVVHFLFPAAPVPSLLTSIGHNVRLSSLLAN